MWSMPRGDVCRMAGSSGAGTTRAAAIVRSLHLAATPTFAVMAVFSGLSGHAASAMWCTMPGAGPGMDGMTLMYVLMALFHAGSWITLACRRVRS